MKMYNVPTDGCNLEIMGYPFFAESVSPNEAFRRREFNFNNIVGGTQKVTPGAYVGLDFSIVTHVPIDPNRPDVHNKIFQEMMSKPVEVVSPELGGRFNAIVVIKPEHDKLDYLKLTISIKEIPDKKSKIPGEKFVVPATRKITKNSKKKNTKSDSKNTKNTKVNEDTKTKSKKNTVAKKTKRKGK